MTSEEAMRIAAAPAATYTASAHREGLTARRLGVRGGCVLIGTSNQELVFQEVSGFVAR